MEWDDDITKVAADQAAGGAFPVPRSMARFWARSACCGLLCIGRMAEQGRVAQGGAGMHHSVPAEVPASLGDLTEERLSEWLGQAERL